MPPFLHRANHCFTAGALAGFITTILIWIASQSGGFLALGVPVVMELTPGWVYQRVVWGGLYGLFFLVPLFWGWPVWRRGLVVALVPSAATLLLFNPIKDGIGLFGLGFGPAWPFLVTGFWLIWGAIAGWWIGQFVDFAGEQV